MNNLNDLKDALGVKTDTELGKIINMSPQTIRAWKIKNQIPPKIKIVAIENQQQIAAIKAARNIYLKMINEMKKKFK